MYRRFYRKADPCDADADINPCWCDEDGFLEIYDQLGTGCGGVESVFCRSGVYSGRRGIWIKKETAQNRSCRLFP